MNASGEGLKEALAGLERGARLALEAFQERAWAQRKGPPFGLQAIVAALGGPGRVVVPASGQEADVEVWGLAHAVELLVRRGPRRAVRRSPEAAARILGRVLYHLGEEHDGIRFLSGSGAARPGPCAAGCSPRARTTRGASALPDLLAELCERAVAGGRPAARDPAVGSPEPAAARVRDRRARSGSGLGLAEACLPGGLSRRGARRASAAVAAPHAACSRPPEPGRRSRSRRSCSGGG